ncbi:hypothetical protein SAMN04490357_0011 [Streptomyces misionensis]|uniref:Uncharacterized protein n=1 Tax=Streptomyces misionensis TaxID=67331 RepID=A0A1H4I608_9ACTN|nr:hypothetical protein [Streptomyces misionensis]SEB29517.1 hypothetical protein SAMN04490357_0011 [Streptomyces misionensis]
MTDRRPLGTGPDRADLSRTRDTEPAPRAQLAAERLEAVPAAEPKPRPTAGRRMLGAGPAAPGGDGHGDTVR